jgi:hypothetical protein
MTHPPGPIFRFLPDRSGLPKAAFAFCLILIFFALGWTSATMFQMESEMDNGRQNAASARAAAHAASLADAALFLWLEKENRRPIADYAAFHSPANPHNALFDTPFSGESLEPSPLLLRARPPARLYFQVSPSGEISSPSVPPAAWLSTAGMPPASQLATTTLNILQAAHTGAAFHIAFFTSAAETMQRQAGQGLEKESPPAMMSRTDGQSHGGSTENAAPRFTGEFSSLFPVWLNGELYLLRRAGTTQGDVIQGILVDWNALVAALTGIGEKGNGFRRSPPSPAHRPARGLRYRAVSRQRGPGIIPPSVHDLCLLGTRSRRHAGAGRIIRRRHLP